MSFPAFDEKQKNKPVREPPTTQQINFPLMTVARERQLSWVNKQGFQEPTKILLLLEFV